jgi:hypothetical protein
VLLVVVAFACAALAQTAAVASVPPLIRVSGTISGDSGGTVGVTFALYAEQTGGAPLWLETQNVTTDEKGRYTIFLGINHAQGVPMDLFASGEARWLGVQPEGQAEQARVQLVSVPYAMTAGDAKTLGGQPLSAFVMASSANGASPTSASGTATAAASGSGIVALASPQGTGGNVTTTLGGTTNYLAKFTTPTNVENSSLVYDSGTAVGIGTTAPAATFHVVSTSTAAGIVDVYNNALTGVTFSTRAARGTPTVPAVVQAGDIIGGFTGKGWTGSGGFSGGRGALIIHANETWSSTGQSTYMQFNTTALGTAAQAERMRIDNAGNVGIGTTNPGQVLDVNGTIRTANGLMFPGGLLTNQGSLGIGTTNPTAPLEVNGNIKLTAGSGGGLIFANGTTQTTAGVTSLSPGSGLTGNIANNLLTLNSDTTYLQQRVSGSCNSGSAIASISQTGGVSCQTVSGGSGTLTPPISLTADPGQSGVVLSAINTNAGVTGAISSSSPVPFALAATATGTAGYTGAISANVQGPEGFGVLINSTDTTGGAVWGVFSLVASSGHESKIFYGELTSPSATGSFLHGWIYSPNATMIQIGRNDISNGPMFSVDGSANVNTSGNINGQTISAGSITAPTLNGNVAVTGNLHVNGNLSKNGGSFKIDHPLDPANKYLYHSFVESPDMMNVYNGVVVFDKKGEAVVELPDWFEALNRDFRYQLTSIGRFMPLYIAREISGNKFKIAGGRPGAKASWQVTGIRQDVYANTHRIEVEVEKTGKERGTYLHPELFPEKTAVAHK